MDKLKKKVCRVIKFNQNAWLKLCNDMITDLRKKLIFEKIFLSWWIMPFLKTTSKHRDIKML